MSTMMMTVRLDRMESGDKKFTIFSFTAFNSTVFPNDQPALHCSFPLPCSHLQKYWCSHAGILIAGVQYAAGLWRRASLQGHGHLPRQARGQDQVQHLSAAQSLIDLLFRESSPSGELQFYQTWGRPFGLASECANLPQFCEYATMQV